MIIAAYAVMSNAIACGGVMWIKTGESWSAEEVVRRCMVYTKDTTKQKYALHERIN